MQGPLNYMYYYYYRGVGCSTFIINKLTTDQHANERNEIERYLVQEVEPFSPLGDAFCLFCIIYFQIRKKAIKFEKFGLKKRLSLQIYICYIFKLR